MNDESLHRALDRLQVPSPSSDAQTKGWHRARMAFVNRPPRADTAAVPVQRQSLPWFAWSAAGMLAALTAVLLWPHPAPRKADRFVLREIETLFPGELAAVITHGGEVKLELSSHDGGSRSQPLAITLRRGHETIEVLTYSGSRVCLSLRGRRFCFEPLATTDGCTILAGENFVWRTGDRQSIAGYQVQAGPASM